MAWVESRPSGGRAYAVVAEERRGAPGRPPRKRVLKSFGNAAVPGNLERARAWAAAYNAAKALRGVFPDDDVARALLVLGGLNPSEVLDAFAG